MKLHFSLSHPSFINFSDGRVSRSMGEHNPVFINCLDTLFIHIGATRFNPILLARSGKGKKASLEQATPFNLLTHSFFSSS